MFFNKYRAASNDYNECVARGNCSTPPEIRALQEVILIFLRQLAFYELKHKELNISYYENKDTLIDGVLMLIAAADFSHEQMLEFMSKIYSKVLYARKEYLNFCTEHNLKPDELKLSLKLSPKMTITEIIQLGEKSILSSYKRISTNAKNLYEILVLVIKSICTNLTHLKEYDKRSDETYQKVLEGLNLLNYQRTSSEKIKSSIDNLARADRELIALLERAQEEKFGEITKNTISLSTHPGKAVLVSGGNIDNLYEVLEQAKNLDIDIDIYTHTDLLIAHCFSKIRAFKNLKGHYGGCFSNCVLDYATFPGAILLTKNTYPNLEYLYRGKIFSAEEIPPKGVVEVKDNNYTPLLEAALEARGFRRGHQVEPISVGYNKNEMLEQITKISNKVISGEIEHLIIIGLSDYSKAQDEYFKKLYRLLPEKSFVISFSHHFNVENELYFNLVNNLPAAYKILIEMFKIIPLSSDKVYFFFTKCDVNSISNMINLNNLGAKHINLSQCPPYVINPNILKTLGVLYNIEPTTTPAEDAERIFNKKEHE